jgi:hemolysin activation/secretion protein
VRYVEPFLAGLPFRLEAALHQELQDSTFTRTRWGARLGHALGTGDRIEAGLEEERVVQSRGAVGTAELQNSVFAYERDGRDDLVSPRRGTRLRVTGTGVFKRETLRAPAAGEPATRRGRAGIADLGAEWHRRLGAGTGLAVELRGVGRFASERLLADFERTAFGGAATLRGHDEEEFRVDRAATSRIEYRWFPGSTGERVSLFWDHASMFTREPVLDTLGNTIGDRGHTFHADGVGLGLRLRAGGGLVDVDYGLAPGRGALDGRIHLRLVSVF